MSEISKAAIDRLVDDDEAAQVLGVKTQTLAAWRSTGRYPLPFVKVGRCVRYRLSDIEEFLNARTVSTTAEGQRLGIS